MNSRLATLFRLVIGLSLGMSAIQAAAAELQVIVPGSEPAIDGKEVDWIYGDYLLKNDHVSLTIAAAVPTRDANMTIRNIGGSILDLTLNEPSNDQLSAYTPTAGRYFFHDPSQVTTGRDGDAVFWQCRSSRTISKDGTTAFVQYRLKDGDAFVESIVQIDGDAAEKVGAFDGVRADGWFSFETFGSVAYCADSFFRQTIGFKNPFVRQPPSWKKGRPNQLRYSDAHVERTDGKLKWTVRLYPATSPADLRTVAEHSDLSPAMYKFVVRPKTPPADGLDAVNRAKVVVRSVGENGDGVQDSFTLQTDDQGIAHTRLIPGKYVAVASAIGCDSSEVAFQSGKENGTVTLPLTDVSGFVAEVKDDQGNFIPVKATIYAADGDHPNFGLSSTRTFVENLVYSVHGRMHCPLDPGKYEIYFSRGPEYDSVRKEVEIIAKEMQLIAVQLDRVVDTTGWVSADLHSHSSPSGDNTSDQYGRVENLLCENVEFAPCTEHNRIDSYTPHLQQMNLTHLMATCTGIELTGSPTPVNHQNSFPLHWHPHTQNGGGPRTSSNPVVQIERLAMWDDASDKLVQINHPNLHQIYGDVDTDGIPDSGFRGMLKWTDVVEVHPLETIFQDIPNNPPSVRRMRIPMFQWLQLLNQGYRIPGVINTDAHYNHHGSGWRRNWFACSTDDPAKISTDEMVRQAESGHIVMSTGPFLSVAGQSTTSRDTAIPGDSLVAADGKVMLKVTVQCPNWLDVNRVQLFISGRPSKKHNYTRKNSPDLFGSMTAVRKFDSSISLSLDQDAHLIVATIGEGMTMEKVMGTRYGKRPPIAVSNPIFVDVDGNGFQHNGDELGMPLPNAAAPATR
ncbi:CehA/McbA family metallohydrolase [Aporhodopirellula aestuarii]|uniref:CehA/McbA family metallohydrolase n=1 Tax=Aporhodopirellula aestuarii TaxID=2950107 RepID=A0ABT0UAY1_9BACT|nr:CehA/McbA family metallohydrolase [Aporhodopirellula aestuarii]MCM2373970.1 CehA/McbA family metallohydrolase [Aporhodopirellula aestuarii]